MRFVLPYAKAIQLLSIYRIYIAPLQGNNSGSLPAQARAKRKVCSLCHYFHQSNWGSLRVMARISLAIRDIIKKSMKLLWGYEAIGLRLPLQKIFSCISKEYSEAPRFLKAKSSAAENSAAIFRRRRFSLTIQILFLHFHYFHQSNFYLGLHYNIYPL